MAVIAFLVFAAAFVAACWTIWATVAPEAGRIVDLLVHGPALSAPVLAPVPPRGGLRPAVRVRTAMRPALLRAAA
ncbi:hypothetical protein LZK98_12375 [Sphingomonas cannabina]|uniref:hypothetical protein n=1 Tax=Sphingomonas cannabina TaxID=2899123 RepID=UPI001F355A48|nr:hypothetical protein [Sphingomonas cannabina]UIJ43886.1 hypothetical protein LZK98_12375 [Sphingomonas cannabina]